MVALFIMWCSCNAICLALRLLRGTAIYSSTYYCLQYRPKLVDLMVCKRKCNLWLSVCFVRCAINWINFRERVKMTKKKRQHKRNHSQQTKKTFDVTGWREIGFQLLIWIFIFVFHIISIFVATEQTIHSMWVMNTKRTCCFLIYDFKMIKMLSIVCFQFLRYKSHFGADTLYRIRFVCSFHRLLKNEFSLFVGCCCCCCCCHLRERKLNDFSWFLFVCFDSVCII